MTILKFYYYPLYRYIEQLYRVEKSEAISKQVILTNKVFYLFMKLENSIDWKFSNKSACVVIFDYGVFGDI